MAKRSPPAQPILEVKINGPGLMTGRIPAADLITICEQVQAAIPRYLLDVLPFRAASGVLPFVLSRDNQLESGPWARSEDVVEFVTSLKSLGNGDRKTVPAEILESLDKLGSVFDRKSIDSLEFFVSSQVSGNGKIAALFTSLTRKRVQQRILNLRSQAFHNPCSIEALAQRQRVKPVTDVAALSGVFLAADDLDGLLKEIYRDRL